MEQGTYNVFGHFDDFGVQHRILWGGACLFYAKIEG